MKTGMISFLRIDCISSGMESSISFLMASISFSLTK